MKKILTLILLAVLWQTVSAQNKPEAMKKNTVFVEVLGNSFYAYSLNYERIVLDKSAWKLAVRIGSAYYREKSEIIKDEHRVIFNIPTEISYLRGKNNHYLELGIGATYAFNKDIGSSAEINSNSDLVYKEESNLLTFARIGYRYQFKEGGPFFKTGFTPIITTSKEKRFLIPLLGVALGYSF